MGIRVEKFLEKYYSNDQLKDVLDAIGLALGGNKKELIDRIIYNWDSYNRDWYELPHYLDWDKLSLICDDFSIPYSDYAKKETLCNKIEENRVLDFRKKDPNQVELNPKKFKVPTRKFTIPDFNLGENPDVKAEKRHKETIKWTKNAIIVGVIVGIIAIVVSLF